MGRQATKPVLRGVGSLPYLKTVGEWKNTTNDKYCFLETMFISNTQSYTLPIGFRWDCDVLNGI